MATKQDRAWERKRRYLEVVDQLAKLQRQLGSKPQRRGSTGQNAQMAPPQKKDPHMAPPPRNPPPRRGSGRGTTIPIFDKKGRQIAEFPVYEKTKRVQLQPKDEQTYANESALAKALRARRNELILGLDDDYIPGRVMRAPEYATNPDGSIKLECKTEWPLFWKEKCRKVKLTPEQRDRALQQMKARDALHKIRPQPQEFRKLPNGGREELPPEEIRKEQRRASQELTQLHIQDAQARLREELAGLNLGRRRVSQQAARQRDLKLAPEAAAPTKPAPEEPAKKKLRIVDKVDPKMKPGDKPVLGTKVSVVNGEKVRLRFVPASVWNLYGYV